MSEKNFKPYQQKRLAEWVLGVESCRRMHAVAREALAEAEQVQKLLDEHATCQKKESPDQDFGIDPDLEKEVETALRGHHAEEKGRDLDHGT